MVNVKGWLVWVCLCVSASMAVDASAFGLGGYLMVGGGTGEVTNETWGGDVDDDIDAGLVGFGFVMDTSPKDQSFFNYRLNVGWEFVTTEEDDSGNETDLAGITVANDFGFAIVRNERFRLWAGPELRLGFYAGENDWDDDVYIFAYGLGPVIGANFGVGQKAVLSVTLGGIYSGFAGEVDDGTETWDTEGELFTYMLNASFLFDL